MKFIYKTLTSLIDINVGLEELIASLSRIGLEVIDYQDWHIVYSQFVVVEIVDIISHFYTLGIKICKVNNGSNVLYILCRSNNIRIGMKVILSPVNVTKLFNNSIIKKYKIKNVIKDNVTFCSYDELLINNHCKKVIVIADNNLKSGLKFSDVFSLDSKIININLTANRKDCMSVYGISRDLFTINIGNLKPKFFNFYNKLLDYEKFSSNLSFMINNSNCHEMVLLKMKDLDNSKLLNYRLLLTLKMLKIKACNTVVDISILAMHEFGRPSCFYDADKIKGKIKTRTSEKGELFTSLNDKNYTLPGGILLITDNNKILSIAGIITGKSSQVDLSTRNIVIEISNFNSLYIFQVTEKLNIRTELSCRFEKGLDHSNSYSFARHLSQLIMRYHGGRLSYFFFILNFKLHYNSQIIIDYLKINKILGFNIKNYDIKTILINLCFIKIRSNVYHVPAWRQYDITNNTNIAAEIIRIQGFDYLYKINKTYYNKQYFDKIQIDYFAYIKNILIYRNIYEIITWSFIKSSYAILFKKNVIIYLINPVIHEFAVMRNSLIPGVLKVIQDNILKGLNNFSFFELGKIFYKKDISSIIEEKCLSIARTGRILCQNIFFNTRLFDFYDLKGDVYSALEAVDIPKNSISINKCNEKYYHPSKSISLYAGRKLIAFIGELRFNVLKKFDIKQTVVSAEIFFNNLPKKTIKNKIFSLSELQSVNKDFSFYINEAFEIKKITKLLKCLKIYITFVVNIIDIYKNNNFVLNKKSITFSTRLQPVGKTLINNEIQDFIKSVIWIIQKKINGEIRD